MNLTHMNVFNLYLIMNLNLNSRNSSIYFAAEEGSVFGQPILFLVRNSYFKNKM